MNAKKTILASLLLTAAVWLFFSWPLAMHVLDGVPSSATNAEKGNVRHMIEGDHLQVIYSYWLFSDMLAGKTPLFHNLYEFNTGNDKALRNVAFDELPLGLVFALGHWLDGRALGWNLMCFTSLWLTFLFTWLLVRNYLKDEIPAMLLSLVSVTLPYRWSAFMGGSPAGLAMAWVPMFLWGVDAAVRRARVLGGFAAGFALLFSYFNDVHVFFFLVLLAPGWAILTLIAHDEIRWRDARQWKKWIMAGLPLAALGIVVLLLAHSKHEGLAGTTVSKGRDIGEVSGFTPTAPGLLSWRDSGLQASIHVGYILPLFLIAGLLVQTLLFLSRPRARWRETVFLILLTAGIVGIGCLMLGPHGPFHGKLYFMARDAIPPYAMIRQAARIFSVLPPLLALAAALSLKSMSDPASRSRIFLAGALSTVLFFEYNAQIRPTVCTLDNERPGYRAVVEDAVKGNREARVIVLPIWPGDTAYTSLYEHYVSLYRIRMINGYQASVPRSYVENVFNVFESVNCGVLTDSHIAKLQQAGINYVILHEDAFPEKVSYFPVAFTLKKLLNHPRLTLLSADQNIWTFKIVDTPGKERNMCPDWTIFFPNFRFEAERKPCPGAPALQENGTSGGGFLRMESNACRLAMAPLEHLGAPNPSLLALARGRGNLSFNFKFDSGGETSSSAAIDSTTWTWKEVAWRNPGQGSFVTPELRLENGTVDIDLIVYASGRLPDLEPGSSFSLPAPLFFHAGHTDLDTDSVKLRKDHEPDSVVFYGPKLPLSQPGSYRMRMVFSTSAPAGTRLGSIHVAGDRFRTPDEPVVAGRDAAVSFSTKESNLPITMFFVYSRESDMAIREVVFSRTD